MIEAFEPWLRAKLEIISQKGKLAEAIRYALSRWEGLARFLDDGRIELDSNVVERAIRPLPRRRTTRSRVSLLVGTMSRRAKVAAGRPPNAKPR